MESDYRRWLEGLRNAEGLLEGTPRYERRVARLREELERMRRDYRDGGVPPQYEHFLEKVADPLVETADAIESSIRSAEEENEFAVAQDDVPAQYEKRVADYFKALSELERRQ